MDYLQEYLMVSVHCRSIREKVIHFPINLCIHLDELQKQIENIQSNWDSNQEFIPTPKSLSKVRLAELDHGLIVEPPEGLEVGWVPIVIEVFHPNGEAQNDIAFLEIELDEDVYGGYISGR